MKGVCCVGTCDTEKRGQVEQRVGLLVGRRALGDALLDERQAVGAQTHWGGRDGRRVRGAIG